MIKIEDLSSVLDNDVLQDLFIQRNETISNASREDKKNLKGLYNNQSEAKKKLGISLENLPNCFVASKRQVIGCVENYIESSAEVTSYFDEKLYKSGVVDGISLMLESIKKTK